jgi:hypothetical protein
VEVGFALSFIDRLDFGVGMRVIVGGAVGEGVKVAVGLAVSVIAADAPHAVNIEKRKIKKIVFMIIGGPGLPSHDYFTSSIRDFERKMFDQTLTKV